ncbi:MAG: type II toxin-antitoxin system VapC family toxin [Acidobacteriota bacterium]
MLFDTDVVIWALRGNARAADAIDRADRLDFSVVSYMELLRGALNKTDLRLTKAFLVDLGFHIVPLTENIGHRASIYLEEYVLKSNLGVPDALIAATAAENETVLCTGNAKDYRAIADIEIKVFHP